MPEQPDLSSLDLKNLRIILYPDPRLKKKSVKVDRFDQSLRDLAERMFVLMREEEGVGLAAPQVGLNIRMFVMNATGNPQEDQVYINPELSDADGDEEGEEGCLSLPGIRIKVVRAKKLKIRAQNLDGQWFEQEQEGFPARVWQHETDHLNGMLLTDRMGPVAKLSWRKTLRELEADFEAVAKGKK